jgi:hypothetical protein
MVGTETPKQDVPVEPVFDVDQNSLPDRMPPVAKIPVAPPPITTPAAAALVPPTFVPPAVREESALSAPIHTYRSDFTDQVQTQGASALRVLAAQADAPRTKAPAPASKSTLPLIVLGVLLVLLASGGIFAAYEYAASNKVPLVAPAAPSLIFVDDRQEVAGTGRELLAAVANAAAAPLTQNSVRLLYISATSTTAGVTTAAPAPGGALIAALQLPAPDILLRSIQPESTVGVVSAGTETRAFFILRVDSYERSFAGMLAWEPTIAEDVSLLYPPYPAPAAPAVATSTATTTAKTTKSAPPPVIAPVTVAPAAFDDEVVDSHDVRVLRDASGRSLIIYGYWDPTTLVIARDEAAFTEILNRLANTKQQ